MILKILFWIFLILIIYAYVGYALLLLLLTSFRIIFYRKEQHRVEIFEPFVTLLIPAYNEAEYVVAKVNNCLALNYPREKLRILWVTDGTTDNTNSILESFPEISTLYDKSRRGKIHAMNRGMQVAETPIVIFTDANTMLNADAIREIVLLFTDENTGCVTGEKRISADGLQKAVGAGEGLYWQYESWIKRLESEIASVMGAVGELFAVRTELYQPVKDDTLLDDFTISMQILQKGYRVKYAPKAWGTETASLNMAEELKRKTRIAAGGIQALTRMAGLLNPFRHGIIALMYFSHKVLRWTLVPLSIPLIFVLNLVIVCQPVNNKVYMVMLVLQVIFYLMVLAGAALKNVRFRFRAIFAPFYLFVMNYAIIRGFIEYLSGRYSVNWQKVKRS